MSKTTAPHYFSSAMVDPDSGYVHVCAQRFRGIFPSVYRLGKDLTIEEIPDSKTYFMDSLPKDDEVYQTLREAEAAARAEVFRMEENLYLQNSIILFGSKECHEQATEEAWKIRSALTRLGVISAQSFSPTVFLYPKIIKVAADDLRENFVVYKRSTFDSNEISTETPYRKVAVVLDSVRYKHGVVDRTYWLTTDGRRSADRTNRSNLYFDEATGRLVSRGWTNSYYLSPDDIETVMLKELASFRELRKSEEKT